MEEELLARFEEVFACFRLLVGGFERRTRGGVFRVADDLATRATVARDEGGAVREGDDGAVAAVGAERAGDVRTLLVGERVERIKADESAGRGGRVWLAGGSGCAGPGFAFCAFCLFACLFCHMVARKQRDADGSHEPGVGRSRDGAADVLLEGAEHRVVAERAALHHDMLAEAVEVGNAHDLREHVRDDRTA